jgi:hypothetical protein
MTMFTVWRFSSPTSGETNLVVRRSEPDEQRYQHAYQLILWRGLARSKEHAFALSGVAA